LVRTERKFPAVAFSVLSSIFSSYTAIFKVLVDQ